MSQFFVWDLSPFLYTSDFISIRYYSLLFGAGLFYLLYRLGKDLNEDLDKDFIDKTFFSLVLCILLGSRLFHCLLYEYGYYSNNLLEIFIPFRLGSYEFIGFQGLSSHGGFAGAILYFFLVVRKKIKIRTFYKFLDSFVLNSLIFISLIRIGNFFNSEIIGKQCSYMFCIIFPSSGYSIVPRHPVQLYESIFYLILFFSFIISESRNSRKVGTTAFYVVSLAITGRFFLEFFKEGQSDIFLEFINMGQLLSFILFFLFFIINRYSLRDLNNENNKIIN
ncbi:prolipoprotein diacylglyceryl transferase [bacterium]|jgi:prolipoprotein diacylglyceryl transferase|nr:prolipoprotein diacylglyceryl transferase [bacterium]MBT3795736.1 prolipoprotein diacylglyceryl transferase [bacterium]MBT4633936.1 prolipoprotein diacylglyceryl transferase [bacterium]